MRMLAAIALVAAPGAVHAQAYQCAVPATVPRPHPELPSAGEPARLLPIGGYTLAVTWAPEFCHGHARDPSTRFECGSGNRFGFTLHGLWPDGIGKEWPQYCAATALLPPALIRQHLCATPSAQLLQHEWAKHGTCIPGKPADYFARSTGLYAKLHYPDLNTLSMSRLPLTAARLSTMIAAANPGMTPDMMRITVNKQGWLDEIWFCLDKAFDYARCKPGTGGIAPEATIKIWRGARR